MGAFARVGAFARWMADFLERHIQSKPTSAIQPKYIGKTALLTPDTAQEYVEIRRHIALLLHELHHVLTFPERNPMIKLDELRIGIEHQDILNNGCLDR